MAGARTQPGDALRAHEGHHAFLVMLNDRLRVLDDPHAIVYEAARLLGEYMQTERVGYARDDGNGATVTVSRNYTRDVPGIEGRYRWLDFGPELLAGLHAGRTVVRRNIADDPTLSACEKAAHAALQLGATVNVPLMRESRLHTVFFVHTAAARGWEDADVALFEDVAQRVRADITRAEAQAAERAANAKLAAAIDSMSDAVFISDTHGRVVEFNDAFASLHRFRSRDSCRTTFVEYAKVLYIDTSDGTPAPLGQWPVPRALRGEVASDVEYRLRRKDTGEAWDVSYSFAPICSDDGSIVGAVVSGRDITHLKKTQEELATSHATLQHLITNQQRVQEDERKRIARELHDDLQQSLAAIRMDAVAIGQRIAAGRRDIDPLLARIDRLSGAAITSTRRIVSDLRPGMLEDLGLCPALEALCGEHARRTGANCRFEFSGSEASADLDGPVLSIGLFRIAQEALNNVAKHAKASTVKVHLDATEDERVTLRILDDGDGIGPRDARDPEAFGLLGMSERVRAMGGQLRIRGNGNHGTVIEVAVPDRDPDLGNPRPGTVALAPRQGWRDRPRDVGVWDVWEVLLQAVIDALDGHVAVLDQHGAIRIVNRAWREFAADQGAPKSEGCGPGADYLEVCRRSAAGDPSAAAAFQGLSAVLDGRDASFAHVYPCDTASGRRWFRMHAASMTGGLAIVSHVAIDSPGGAVEEAHHRPPPPLRPR